jgi:Na+/proline symporter
MSWVLLAIVGYVLLQFAIGAWVSRNVASASDYILAGRSLGTGLVVFSVFATYFGAEAIVASGGAVYERGLAGAVVDPVSYAAASCLRARSGRGVSPPLPTCSGSATHPAWSGWS